MRTKHRAGAAIGAALRAWVLVLLVAFGPIFSATGWAAHARQAATLIPGTTPLLRLNVSQGRLLNLPSAAGSVFIADPTIADVQVPLPTRVFVFGKKAGQTTLYALDGAGKTLLQLEVDVENDTVQPTREIERNPTAGDIRVHGTDNGLALEGSAITPESASDASRAATDALSEKQVLDDHVKVRNSVQVTLRVRIAQVDRTISKELNFNLEGGFTFGAFPLQVFQGRQVVQNPAVANSPFLLSSDGAASLVAGVSTKRANLTSVIDAMAQEGLVTILAEPNLTTISGQPASFLAGGEFPIPIVQNGGGGGNNSISIVFKQYGVSLQFVPTVLASNHISLHVRPEVSQLSDAGSINLNGITIPALDVRRADTTVELGSGETFAIAGLLQNDTTSQVQRFPGLGDLPILGPLFRSSSFKRNESELMIIVTPYIVKPIDDPNLVQLPTDGLRPATDLDRILKGRITARDPGTADNKDAAGTASLDRPQLVGAAGFDPE